MNTLIGILDKAPVATIIIVILAIVGGVDLVIDGELSEDFRSYADNVGIAAGLLGVGRGIAARKTPPIEPRT